MCGSNTVSFTGTLEKKMNQQEKKIERVPFFRKRNEKLSQI